MGPWIPPRRTCASTPRACRPTSTARLDGRPPSGVRCGRTSKTHKSPEIARLQPRPGAVGLTRRHGRRGRGVRRPRRRPTSSWPIPCGWTEGAGPPAAARWPGVARPGDRRGLGRGGPQRAVGRCSPASGVRVLVEVDSGQHRSGVPRPARPAAVAAAAAEAGLEVEGVFTFPGHGYAPGRAVERRRRRGSGALATGAVAAELVRPGAAASSAAAPRPTLAATRARRACVDRAAPGRLRLRRRPAVGARHRSAPDRIALTCRATVVSHAGGRVVRRRRQQDARRRPAALGHRLRPAARRTRTPGWSQLSEHHAVVEGLARLPAPLGSRLDAGAQPRLQRGQPRRHAVRRGPGPLETWAVAARGRNS